jgi:hypothetical protein
MRPPETAGGATELHRHPGTMIVTSLEVIVALMGAQDIPVFASADPRVAARYCSKEHHPLRAALVLSEEQIPCQPNPDLTSAVVW